MSASPSRPRAALHALGCRVNADEVAALASHLLRDGWAIVPFGEEAELQVLNTCTVTLTADAEGRKLVRRAARRKAPGGLLVVTGCYAQRDPRTLRGLEGVDLVLGNVEKAELLDHLRRLQEDRRLAGELWVSEAPRTRRFLDHATPLADAGRTRATLKIQDGCDEACTYCIIPSVRGPSTSREHSEILREARRLASFGYREIALTGVHSGSYGRDRGEEDGLAGLVRDLHGLGLSLRYRLNSLEPATLTETLLEALAEAPSFCRHFHVPLQHGHDRVLRRMGRNYRAAFYRERIERLAGLFAGAGIGADVMVGFPGESDEEFEATCSLIRDLPLSYLHVFPWSPRPGTPAARLGNRLDEPRRKERLARMHELDRKLRSRFQRTLAGRTETVLIESEEGPGGLPSGLAACYLRVDLVPSGEGPEAPARSNTFRRVLLDRPLDPHRILGRDLGPAAPFPGASPPSPLPSPAIPR